MSGRSSGKNRRFTFGIAALAAVIALFAFSCLYKGPADPARPSSPENTASYTGNSASGTADEASGNANTASNTTDQDNTETADNTNADVPSADPKGNIDNNAKNEKRNTNTNENNIVLTETEYADRSYIEETLFLGDSNTAMYLTHQDDQGQPYTTVENTIGVFSMGIEHIDILQCMSFSTGVCTIPESVSILQPRRMILMFGTNNLKDYGEQGAENFASNYAAQIRKIQDSYPDADIIINTVPPATMDTSFWSARIETINAFNAAIERMCAENGWRFLNSFEALTDKTGYGDPDLFLPDGLHLNQKGVDKMFSYIRSHALYTKDRRTMPLKEIPRVYGPYTEMLLYQPPAGSQD